MHMGFLAWIVLGGVAGYIASLIITGAGAGVIMDIILGIVGGLVGGEIIELMGHSVAGFFNPMSWIVAIAGALIVVFIYRKVIT